MNIKRNEPPEIKVSYQRPKHREILEESAQVYEAFLLRWNKDTLDMYEELMVLYLDHQNAVIGHKVVSRGGINMCAVDIRIILSIALKCNSSSIMICHNHPSGQLRPSFSDISLTKKIHKAASLLDIKLLEHLIITSESYLSFYNEGLIQST